MNILIFLYILLYNILPVLIPFIKNYYILIHLEVRVFILPQIFLQHIHTLLLDII